MTRIVTASLAALALAAVVAASSPRASASFASSTTLSVSPSGSDTNPGTAAAPLRTIQAALDRAKPGTTIQLAPGIYRETLHTRVAGTAAAPIVIKGPETGKDPARRHVATLYGTGRIVNIDHSYYTLTGFTIDGQEQLAGTVFPTTVAAATAFKTAVQSKVADGRLVYIGSADSTRDVTGVRIDDMYLHAAGGDCVRLRNGAHDNTIANSLITWCGLYGKSTAAGVFEFHNGEGVYIGTSPKSTDQPMAANDPSAGNVVDNDTIATFGSECFDVKENAHDNVLSHSICLDNTEPAADYGSNVELRGYANRVLANTIANGAGFGVKIAADSAAYDLGGNTVQGNRLYGTAGVALRITAKAAQGVFCGNLFGSKPILDGTAVGDPTAACL